MGLFFRGLCKHCDTCDSKKAKTPVVCARTRACEEDVLEGLEILERLEILEGTRWTRESRKTRETRETRDSRETSNSRKTSLFLRRVVGGDWHSPLSILR